MAGRMLKVFVSSTSEDLKDYRAAARNEILHMQWHPEMMEYFGALPDRSVDACRSKLEQSDVVLLLVGFRRGWVPTREQGGDGDSSITALELACARELKKPVLVMLASEDWPNRLCEQEQAAREWVQQFRKGLNQPATFFDHEPPVSDEAQRLPTFRTKVRAVLLAHQERLAEEEAAAPGEGSGDFASAMELLKGGECIPFLGPGIYGDGPLSTGKLVKELWPDAPDSQACLATASEYAERHLLSRESFLTRFGRILSDQAKDARSPAVHDLVEQLCLQPPPLVVAASHDMVLEDRLALHRRCAVVAHILRSYENEHDGKLLVCEQGQKPKICLADQLDLKGPDQKGPDLVVYKPLGSPLLHRGLDPELEIDTVVATEEDHLTFLGRLENQHTKVPSAFHRPFQRRPILFLGLPLDVWHYRLVLQVFRSMQLGSGRKRSLAVRRPESKLETLAWQNLQASLIQMAPNDFAQQVLQSMSAVVQEVSHG